jgi:hypothetical protein
MLVCNDAELKQLRNEMLVQSLLNFDSNLKEVVIDLLTVIANKPTNYTGVKEYTLDQLQKLAGDYARIRHPDSRAPGQERPQARKCRFTKERDT